MPFRMDEKLEEQQGTTAPNISGIQGVGSVDVGLNVPQGAARAGKAEPQKSGQYQNLQQYLRSNQPQTQALAGRLTGEVESRVGEAEKAGEAFKAEAPKVQAYDPTEALKQFTVPQGTGATVGLPQERVGAATEPMPGQQKQRQENYLMQRQTGGFTGPTDITQFGSYGALQTASQRAQEALKAAGSETGQRELLKSIYARPTYAGGQSALDQALFAQSPAGQQALTDLSKKYAGLGETLKGFEREAQTGLTASQKQAAENIAAFAPAEQAAEKAILSPIEERAAQANLNQQYQNLVQDLADLQLSPETLQALGLSEGQRIYGTNLLNFIGAPAQQASIQNLATREERQRYNDLMNFIGGNAQQLGLGEPTYQPYQVNREALKTEIGQREAAFNQLAKQRIDPINAQMAEQVSSGYGLPIGMDQFVGMEPTPENLQKAIYTFENADKSAPKQAFIRFLNGAPPPEDWGWDSATQDRYRAQYSWYTDMKNALNELNQAGYQSIVNPNKMSVAPVLPSGIMTKTGGL